MLCRLWRKLSRLWVRLWTSQLLERECVQSHLFAWPLMLSMRSSCRRGTCTLHHASTQSSLRLCQCKLYLWWKCLSDCAAQDHQSKVEEWSLCLYYSEEALSGLRETYQLWAQALLLMPCNGKAWRWPLRGHMSFLSLVMAFLEICNLCLVNS